MQDSMLFETFEGRKREGKLLILVCSWIGREVTFQAACEAAVNCG